MTALTLSHLSEMAPEQDTAATLTTCLLFSSQLSGCLALSWAVPASWSSMKTWSGHSDKYK